MNKVGEQLRLISDINLPLSSTCLCIRIHTHLLMDVLRLIKNMYYTCMHPYTVACTYSKHAFAHTCTP